DILKEGTPFPGLPVRKIECGEIKLWDAETGEERKAFRGHPDAYFMALALSPDGKLVATGDCHNGVTLWDAAEGKELVTFSKDVVSALTFSPDGKHLAAAAKIYKLKEPSGEIRLWDVAAVLKGGKKRSEPLSDRDYAQPDTVFGGVSPLLAELPSGTGTRL